MNEITLFALHTLIELISAMVCFYVVFLAWIVHKKGGKKNIVYIAPAFFIWGVETAIHGIWGSGVLPKEVFETMKVLKLLAFCLLVAYSGRLSE